MLICKYTRLNNAAFVPHLDTLRAITMGIRRVGANIEYSEGFNPHMKIFFGQPLPIGAESKCEYFCAYINEQPEIFMEKINKSLPSGLRITRAKAVDKDPNVAKIMYFADYTVTMRDIIPNLKAIKEFYKRPECVIEYTAKGETCSKDVKELIKFIKVAGDKTVKLRLRCGNGNLRADRLMNFLQSEYNLSSGYDIIKTRMYDCNENDLDKILFGS